MQFLIRYSSQAACIDNHWTDYTNDLFLISCSISIITCQKFQIQSVAIFIKISTFKTSSKLTYEDILFFVMHYYIIFIVCEREEFLIKW